MVILVLNLVLYSEFVLTVFHGVFAVRWGNMWKGEFIMLFNYFFFNFFYVVWDLQVTLWDDCQFDIHCWSFVAEFKCIAKQIHQDLWIAASVTFNRLKNDFFVFLKLRSLKWYAF